MKIVYVLISALSIIFSALGGVALVFGGKKTSIVIFSVVIIFLIIHELNLNRNTLLLSLLFGLLLSTRLSAIIPFIIYYFNEYIHLKLKKQIIVFSFMKLSTSTATHSVPAQSHCVFVHFVCLHPLLCLHYTTQMRGFQVGIMHKYPRR